MNFDKESESDFLGGGANLAVQSLRPTGGRNLFNPGTDTKMISMSCQPILTHHSKHKRAPVAQQVKCWPAHLAVHSLIPTRGRDIFYPEWGSMAHSLSLSSIHHPDMTIILSKRTSIHHPNMTEILSKLSIILI